MAAAMKGVHRGERRGSRRHARGECGWLTAARLRHGLDVEVVNLASGGALVEATARLLPGATVELHLAAPDWCWWAAARVLRCHVSAVVPEHGVRYRAALRFNRVLVPPPAAWPDDKLSREPGHSRTSLVPSGGGGSDYPSTSATGAVREVPTQSGGWRGYARNRLSAKSG